jgi:hypothetical protein
MHNHIQWFQFNVTNGQSIGPVALRQIWSQAAETADTSVSRRSRDRSLGRTDTYAFHASPRLKNALQVEARLRRLLEESRLVGTLIATPNA